jgi:Glyoxalase-like domain
MTAPADGLHLLSVSIDCADPDVLGDFYVDLLGGEVAWRSEISVGVRVSGLLLIAQRVDPYRPPIWPGNSIVHLDLSAGDLLDEPEARALSLGATLPDFQPDERWRVLLDPAGHPFCITTLAP